MSNFKSLLGLNEFSVDSLNIANLDLTNTNIIGLNTDRVPEDADPVNLYFTNSRFDARMATTSINALSDVTITGTPADDQLLIYNTGQWRNTNPPFLRLDGTASMTGSINMGGQSITNVNLVDGIDVSVLDSSVVKLTGNQSIAGTKTFTDKITTAVGKPVIIGRSAKGVNGPTGGLELYGNYADNIGGAHLQAVTSEDDYPTFSLINTSHGSIFMGFDAYIDNFNWRSSYATSNFAIAKSGDYLRIFYDSNKSVGSIVQWENVAITIDTAGLLYTKAITASGLITANAGIDMKSQNITNMNLLNTISVSSIITTSNFNSTFDTQLATKSTTNLAEGTNLYYTTARDNSNFDTRLATKSTTNLAEGTNLYYTTARANTDFDTRLGTKSTTNLAEGTNLYYTTARANTDFDTRLGTKSTTNLAEGTNLYYTTARANTDFDTRLGTKSIDALSDVVITAPVVNGQLLSYNGTNWVNSTGSLTYLPLAGGTMSGAINMGTQNITNAGTITGTAITSTAGMTTTTLTASGLLTSDGGCKLSIQNKVDGGNGQGIFMWDTDNTEWGIYLASGNVSAKSFAGGIAPLGNDFTFGFRFRAYNNSGYGFIWENSSEQLLMSLNGANGTLWTKGLITASAGITYTGTLSSATNTSGAKIGVQGTTDGTSAKGIFLWDTTNVSWGIYAASGGALNTRSLANGLAVSGNDFSSYSFRFRVANDATMGFIWENSSEQLLMSLNGANGTLWTKGLITASAGVSTTTLTTSDNIIIGTGKSLFIDRNALANNKLVLWDGGVTSTTAFLGFGVASNTLLYNVNAAADSHVFYYGATNELFRINNTAITASKSITANAGISTTTLTTSDDVVVGAGKKVFIDRSGFANNKLVLWDGGVTSTTGFLGFGVASDILLYNVNASSTSHVFYHSGVTELLRINNTAITASKSITANDKITTALGKPIIIGATSKLSGITGGLELFGTASNANGPHIQSYISTDNYPTFQVLNYLHDAVYISFDCFYDFTSWKSSHSTSCFQISKEANQLNFNYKVATAGSNINGIQTSYALTISSVGAVKIYNDLDMNSKKITNVATPTATTDATNKSHVDTLDGQNVKLTGDQTIAGVKTFSSNITTSNGVPIIIGRTSKSGVSGGLEVYGNVNSSAGPHIQCVSSEDNNPSFQVLAWSHGNINLVFDAYYSGASWISSNSTSNFLISKNNYTLTFSYKGGVTAGSGVTWSTGPFLDTAGTFTIPATGANTTIAIGTRPSITTEPLMVFRSNTGANNRGAIGWSGTQLYAWSTPNANGDVGSAYNYVPQNGAWGFSSDRRLKSDIKTLESDECCQKLLKLNCYSYYWKSDEKKEKKSCGFIADEVKKVFPDFVDTTDMKIGEYENIEGVTYMSFIPILVSAFQHTAERIVKLEKQNNNIMNILEDLSKQLAEIRAEVFDNGE